MNKISVVLTTYNRKYEVRRALDSVYAQTESPYEVILVDDCSEDGTKEYIDSFQFEKLTYVLLPERKGPGAARNCGISQASGDYIAFLDSDNEWCTNRLEELIKFCYDLNKEWDILYNKYKKHVNFEYEILPKEIETFKLLGNDEIWFHNLADASSTIYKKKFLEETGYFSEKLFTNIDWEILLRASRSKKIQIQRVDKVLTENWTMFNGITEDKELEHKERTMIFNDYAQEFFDAIIENNGILEQQYENDLEQYKAKERQYQTLLARKTSFYDVMSKWLQLKLEGRNIAEILLKQGYGKIAIYGAGKHGQFLCQDLRDSAVQVVYFIDRKKENFQNGDIEVYTLSDSLPEVDAIVVSPYLEFQNIKQELELKCNYKLVALNELVEW